MIVDKISYQKTFPLAPYVNEKIGVEIQVEESDDWEEVFKTAKRMVEAFHKDNNPGLYIETNSEYPYSGIAMPSGSYDKSMVQVKEEPKEKRIGVMVDDILSCDSLKILETYRFIKDTNEELKAAYGEQYAKLSNQ